MLCTGRALLCRGASPPGRPLLYETTDLFLEHFGIRTVEELPNSAELRSVKLPEPEPAKEEAPPEEQTEIPLEGAESAPPFGEETSSGEAPAEEKPQKKSRGKKKKETTAEEEGASPGSEEAPVVVMEESPAGQ